MSKVVFPQDTLSSNAYYIALNQLIDDRAKIIISNNIEYYFFLLSMSNIPYVFIQYSSSS